MKNKDQAIVIVSVCILFFLTSVSFNVLASDNNYPTKPITMYIPYGAGGPTDVSARVLASAAEKILGQPITPVNRPGGGGTLVFTQLRSEKPDGYTISVLPTSVIARTPHIMEVDYDIWNDFDFIMKYGLYTMHLATTNDKPYSNFKELIDYVKDHPNEVKVSTTGPLEAETLVPTYLSIKEDIKWYLAPFDSTADAMAALLGGHVDLCSASGLTNYLAQVEEGDIIPLVTYNEIRSPVFPDTPTLVEEGFNLVIASGMGIAAPKGLPEEIAAKLENAFIEATSDPAFLQVAERLSMPLTVLNREEFLKSLKDEYEVSAELIDTIGIN
jgi:tripartite-type tricarboxylate transporter receptor subunit TctC